MQAIDKAAVQGPKTTSSADIVNWRPEDEAFWKEKGSRIANRNLWISIPSLLCGFAVWLMWGLVTVQMSNAGYPFKPEELLPRLPPSPVCRGRRCASRPRSSSASAAGAIRCG